MVLAVAVLATLPAGVDPRTHVPGDPDLEAVDHLWTLWAGLRHGPLVIDTPLLDFPLGYRWVLADPLDLPWFALGAWSGGPFLGLWTVHLGNLLLAGLGAALLTREVLADRPAPPAFAAVVAATLPALGSGFVTGMTEAQTMGWVAIALAAVHRVLRTGSWRATALAGAALGACAWAGPYTALYAGLTVPLLVIGAWGRHGRGGRSLGQLAVAAALGLLVTLPVLLAIASRGGELPGTVPLPPGLLGPPDAPENRLLGADVASLLLPVGSEAQAVYLGLVTVVLAGVGLRRRAVPWPLVLPGAAALLLSLGFYLQVAGQVVTAGETALPAPASWLTSLFPPLGRAPRWYRMATVAGLLLAPLAAAGAARIAARHPRWPVFPMLGGLVLADALVASPAPWPRPSFPAEVPGAYAQLEGTGALLEVGARATHAKRQLLWQCSHGRAIGGNPLRPPWKRDPTPAEEVALALESAARHGSHRAAEEARARAAELGFEWIVHHPEERASEVVRLAGVLGPPDVGSAELLAWRVD